jgi:ABC-type transporter Mla MlaB component
MLRISFSSAPLPTVHLDGKLLAPWLEEVSSAITAVSGGGSFRVDLAALSYADHDGAALLVRLRKEGVALVGASAFIEQLLDRQR